MAVNITTNAATDIASSCPGIYIQVNAALTGTITVTSAGSTFYNTTSSTIATITNPTVGSSFKYGNLKSQGKITVTASTTCDVTVTVIDHIN